MTPTRVADIARALSMSCAGDTEICVSGLSEPASADPGDLAVAMDSRYLDELAQGQAKVAMVPAGTDWQELGLEAAIFVDRPRLALSRATRHFAGNVVPQAGVHPSAHVAESAELGPGVHIGPNVVIEDDVRVGANSVIGAGCVIGAGSSLGSDCTLCANVTIGASVRAGDRLIAHSGVVIGSDGFSFVTPEKSAVENVRENLADSDGEDTQAWIKIHSLGGVEIGDDVEIGANSSVDAGTIRPTRLADGTKVDALVQVGHNAQVGRNVLLCAHVAVGGSAVVGDNSVLGGQVGVADNVTLGTGVIAGGATKILSNVPAGRAVLGYPAMKMDKHVETYKALRRLPRLLATVARLEKAVPKNPKDE